MFKEGQTVLVTRDWEDNNTGGKLGIILDTWVESYLIGFFDEINKTNGSLELFKKKYGSVKSTWWVKGYALKKAMTKNKFK